MKLPFEVIAMTVLLTAFLSTTNGAQARLMKPLERSAGGPVLGSGPVFDAEIAAPIKAQMLDDLAFIQSIQSNGSVTPFHQAIFGAVNGPSYYQWFTSRVLQVGKDDCGSANAVACVIPSVSDTKIWITDNYIKFSHPQIARLSVVYHEARHTESNHGNWAHATCPTPFVDDLGHEMRSIWTGASLSGEPACDVTPYGSYGSATIFLKNISKFCSNCSDKVKTDAGIYGDDQLNRITDGPSKAAMKNDFQTHLM